MAEVVCPECAAYNSSPKPGISGTFRDPIIRIQCGRTRKDPGSLHRVELQGIITCKYDGHKRPIRLVENTIDDTARNMPLKESQKLNGVPDGLVEDIEEAESAHFAENFKASVVMCRRAINLALEEILKATDTLGPLLKLAQKREPPLLKPHTYSLAERVREYGDKGAHRVGVLDAKAVEVAVFDTVVVLNELYETRPASR